jgi:hypothetical protein
LKMHGVSLLLFVLCLTLVAVPAMAQERIIYDNGPVNGQVNALLINFGFAVTDSFQNNDGTLYLSSFSFYAWLFPGDYITQLDVSMGSTPYGSELYHGTIYGPGQGNCFINKFGYNVCLVSVDPGYLYPYGTVWLTLQNASARSGSPVYWDQNSGVGCLSQGCPSKALQKAAGFIPPTASVPSETFTIYGYMIDRANTTGTAH